MTNSNRKNPPMEKYKKGGYYSHYPHRFKKNQFFLAVTEKPVRGNISTVSLIIILIQKLPYH